MRALLLPTAVLAAAACRSDAPAPAPPPLAKSAPMAPGSADPYAAARDELVRSMLAGRDITDARVLEAMRRVPRHAMVPAPLRAQAYEDRPLPIGHEQTISQPYVVAAMTQAAALSPGERVLEVGTGSGYQAAVLAELGDVEVYSIEIVRPLAERTQALLQELGYTAVHTRIGDGYRGWPEAAPFDAIIVTAAPPAVPAPLVAQLAVGGRLVIPVGEDEQHLQVLTKQRDGTVTTENLFEVRFVPMTGQAQQR